MTLRLVALMSVVLLLCLAAFAFLLNHYQGEVLEEVGRTASAVGRATLRTLDHRADGDDGGAVLPLATEPGTVLSWTSAHVQGETRTTEVQAADPSPIGRIERVVSRSSGDRTVTVHQEIICPGACPEALTRGADAAVPDRPAEGDAGQKSAAVGFIINVEGVHAEPAAQGLILKIPRFIPAHTGAAGAADYELHELTEGLSVEDVWLARREEIELPIPLGDYQQLFDSMRRRSLYLFLGVFVVGTVLSTGLATRFTRPIRQLDGGIRRLSEGDLDVEVAVQGRDEIGRLSRAFNEMARKLRVNRERTREVVRREKLSALGRLAAGVAHDVRNPLHSINLTLQHLNDTCRPDESSRAGEFDQSLEIIRGEIRRLDQLVGNFLGFARSERRDRQAVDLGRLLGETVRLVRSEAERRQVALELQVDERTPEVRGDGEGLRSALLNLVLNSFEAMPRGGTLSLSVQPDGDGALVEVADTGEGIPEADQERVFDFAYSTREGGTGLGLAMVHHCVVDEHGGRIALQSRPAEGTRVRLWIPAGAAGGAAA